MAIPRGTKGFGFLLAAAFLAGAAPGRPGPGATPPPAWTAAPADQANANFGSTVSSAGDVNGDGFGDVIVGAPAFDGGAVNIGRVYLYAGGETGLSVTPSWSASGTVAGGRLGASLASAGDVNGDGFDDIIVGAPGARRAFVYYGGAGGLAGAADWSATVENGAFGASVSGAGDVNNDGFDEVLVANPEDSDKEDEEGKAFLYLGSAMGIAAAPAWTVRGGEDGYLLGTALSAAGDVDGDGYDDVIVGVPGNSAAWIFRGTATGLSPVPAWRLTVANASGFGSAVSGGGDVNRDGFSDVVVGAHQASRGQTLEGAVFVFHGSAAGLPTTPALVLERDQVRAFFGSSVSMAGDINGDGYGDACIGAPSHSTTANPGAVFIYYGGAAGLSSTAGWTATCAQGDAAFGKSASIAGDVDGNGSEDIIAGANLYDDPENGEGAVFVWTWPDQVNPPELLPQCRRDGSTSIPKGGSTTQSAFVALGQVTQLGSRPLRLEVELKPVDEAFDGRGTTIGAAVPSGSIASVTVDRLMASTGYRWRARGVNANGGKSDWVDAGMSGGGGIDFSTSVVDPPPTPSAGQFRSSDGSTVDEGARIIEDRVDFVALLTQGDGHDVRFEVEVRPVGVPFSDVATAAGPMTRSGSTSSAAQPLAPGLYRWQCRAIEAEWNLASPWISFGENAEDEADLTLLPGGSIGHSDICLGSAGSRGAGPSWIAIAAVALASALRSRGLMLMLFVGLLSSTASAGQPDAVHDLRVVPADDGTVTLQWTTPGGLPTKLDHRRDCYYEVRHDGREPAGSVDAWAAEAAIWPRTQAPNATGTPDSMTVDRTDPGMGRWYAIRTFDDKRGDWSGWSNVAYARPDPPRKPLSPLQFRRDGLTELPRGATTTQSAIVVRAEVSDPGGRDCRLQIEVKAEAIAFDETEVLTGAEAVPSGAVASVRVTALEAAARYRWRVRTINTLDAVSAWADFGEADLGQIDLATSASSAPSLSSAGQFLMSEGGSLGVGGNVVGDDVRFQAFLAHADGNDSRLQVEVRLAGAAFSGVATAMGPAVPGGGIATATQPLAPGLYHWQARAVESEWNLASPWVDFGGNAEGAADFNVLPGGSSGNGGSCLGSAGSRSAGPSWIWIATITLGSVLSRRGRLLRPAALALLMASATWAGQDTAGGPVGYWRGDDAAHPTVVADGLRGSATGQYLNGAASVSMPQPAPLKSANPGSMSFDGDDDYVDIPGFAWPAAGGPVTVAFWNYYSGAAGHLGLTFGVGDNGARNNRFHSHAPWDDGKLYWDYGDIAGAGAGRISASYAGRANKWTHVALVSQGNGGSFMAIYLDGVLAASATTSDGPDIALTGINLGRGKSLDAFHYHRGQIDEFRVYDRVLGAEEIQILAAGYSHLRPPAPTQLGQRDLVSTAIIPPGGSTPTLGFEARAIATNSGEGDVRLEIEVQPINTTFSGSPNFPEGPLVASGSEASVTVTGLTDHQTYHWQTRTRITSGLASAWTGYGGDLFVGTNIAPAEGVVDQFRASDGARIGAGQRLADIDGLRFEVMVMDHPLDRIRLQVEVIAAGSEFRDESSAEGDPVAGGTVALCQVRLPPGLYEWQYRLVDARGAASIWSAYEGVGMVDFEVIWAGSQGGGACSGSARGGGSDGPWMVIAGAALGLALRRRGLVLMLFVGLLPSTASAGQPDAVRDLRVISADGGTVTLEWTAPGGITGLPRRKDAYYELRYDYRDPAGSVGSWASGAIVWPDQKSLAPEGRLDSMTVSGITDNAWVWFAIRTFDDRGGEWSGWSNVALSTPDRPEPPGPPAQLMRDKVTEIPWGSATTQSGFIVRARVSDRAARRSRLQIEVKRDALPFDESDILTGMEDVASGSVAFVGVGGLAAQAGWRWRIRTINSIDRVSGWVIPEGAGREERDLATMFGQAPALSSPFQALASGGRIIGIGEKVLGEWMTFQAWLEQGDDHEVWLEVEARPVGEPFTGMPTASGSRRPSRGLGTASQELSPGPYHVQGRAVDGEWSRPGPWMSYQANGEDDADFIMIASGSLGHEQVCHATAGSTSTGRLWILVLGLVLSLVLKRG